jgi:hypothetical protein
VNTGLIHKFESDSTNYIQIPEELEFSILAVMFVIADIVLMLSFAHFFVVLYLTHVLLTIQNIK